MFGLRGGMIAGKIGYALSCLVAAVMIVTSGWAHNVVRLIGSAGSGTTIKGGSAPVGAAMNILVMGLESRTDYYGNTLSRQLLVALHAGKIGGNLGAQDTNTLMLIHIFAGGQKAVGFSIPRDDLVNFPQPYLGYSRGKIDAAYDWAYNQYLDQTPPSSMSSNERYLKANQAGQAATIATVQALTGVHIDHFVEVNLAGFFYLAQAFGGIEVCIKPAPSSIEPNNWPTGTNLTDKVPYSDPVIDNSGFNAYLDGYNKGKQKGGAQYLHLQADQALAFVRARDTLPGIDLGRTHRQQAVIDYVIYELKHEGMFSDFSKLNNLLSTASKYLMTDPGFASLNNLVGFATEMRALSGQNLRLTTLPYTPENNVYVPGYPTLQDVNIIDVTRIKQLVQNAFYPQAAKKKAASKGTGTPIPPASTVTVDVYNGDLNAAGLAGKFTQALVALGYKADPPADASAQSKVVQPGTQVFYGAGTSANAAKIAADLGVTAQPLASLPAGHVEVLIGSTVTQVPAGLASPGGATASTQSTGAEIIGGKTAAPQTAATPAPSGTSSQDTGAGTVSPNAKYGIPCVY